MNVIEYKLKMSMTNNKRGAVDGGESSSDDDFGPSPLLDTAPSVVASEHKANQPARKKVRRLEFEQVYLENLPSAEQYERSFMHRDIVTHVVVARQTDYIITGSADGHVKFWKKMLTDIEFVKHFQAHLAPINALVVSPDGKMLVTTSMDKMIKFFDVMCFDMSNMIKTSFTPDSAVWICQRSGVTSGLYNRVAVADVALPIIRIFLADGSQASALVAEVQLHTHPVRCMSLNVVTGTVISVDSKGIIEYWDGDSLLPVSKPDVNFEYKSETDLYDLAKCRTTPCSISCAPTGNIFAVYAADKIVRVFDFKSGKVKRKYDESVAHYQRLAAASGSDVPSSTIEMGRKVAIEKELDATPELLKQCTLTFDESGNFLIFGSLTGIKILNILTNVVSKVLGNNESGERFLATALYQGIPKVDMQYLLSVKGGKQQTKTVDETESSLVPDPTLYCTSLKRRRLYCFSKREPDESGDPRDVLNERPTEEERVAATDTLDRSLAREAIIRTTRGDIHLKLFASECPKTVENFVTHARNGYYNNIIFHRVIKGFMLQTGDPKGDGTGGESIWGGEFEDEFVKNLRHDRPYTLSMANAGPNTNGSQFFITTVPTPWLDNKHTVFGRATKGFDVLTDIENAKVNKYDKPLDEIKMIGIDIVG